VKAAKIFYLENFPIYGITAKDVLPLCKIKCIIYITGFKSGCVLRVAKYLKETVS